MFASFSLRRAAGLTFLLAACVLPARGDDKDTKPAHNAVKAASRDAKWWTDRHEKFVARARKGDVDVVFLGDSITQGWETNGKDAWKDTFEPLKAANFGIGGDQTGHVLWRITAGKELEPITPKVAVVMIGTNNAGRDSAEQIAEGITAIVKELRRQKPDVKVLLLGVFPRAGKRPGKEATEVKAADLHPKMKQINEIIAKLDDGKHIHYKDIGGKFLDENGNLPKAIMPDYLHLSKKGYAIWADAIKDDVKKLLGK